MMLPLVADIPLTADAIREVAEEVADTADAEEELEHLVTRAATVTKRRRLSQLLEQPPGLPHPPGIPISELTPVVGVRPK